MNTVDATHIADRPDRPDTTGVAAALRLSTTRLARRLRTEAEIGLTPSLLSALAVIHLRGPLTLGALAELEGVAPPTVTKIVAKLQQQGLAGREVDPDDRRIARVSITEAGDALLAESRERKTQWLARQLDDLDEEQLEVLRRAAELIDELLSPASVDHHQNASGRPTTSSPGEPPS